MENNNPAVETLDENQIVLEPFTENKPAPAAAPEATKPKPPSKTPTKPKGSIEIPIALIDAFPNHPYRVENDATMKELVQSIKENGLIVPPIVRKKEDGRYELISGHRRKMACELAGMKKMPVTVREIDRDAATLLMVDSNLQRENIRPSEKAFAYKMRLEAMKRQAGRPNQNNYSPMDNNLARTSSAELSEKVGESTGQIFRYVRLTQLHPEILTMVDAGKLGFRPAVELSFLKSEEQTNLLETMHSEERTPSLSQAQRMKQLSADGQLDETAIEKILTEEKPNQAEKVSFKAESFRQYFPKDYTSRQMEEKITELLESWQRHRQQNREAR